MILTNYASDTISHLISAVGKEESKLVKITITAGWYKSEGNDVVLWFKNEFPLHLTLPLGNIPGINLDKIQKLTIEIPEDGIVTTTITYVPSLDSFTKSIEHITDLLLKEEAYED